MNTINPMTAASSSAVRTVSPAEAAKEAPEVQDQERKSLTPRMDEYIPEEKQEPSGRYWLGKDKNGQPKIYFDDPERAAEDPSPQGAEEEPEAPEKKEAPERKAERCTCNTDKVDREIENLKKKREELKQQLSTEADSTKAEETKRKLARLEQELSQKDNDTYRRQHAEFS